ncbi:MAG: protein translocase subunit SecD [Aggregatilineales bacterium]
MRRHWFWLAVILALAVFSVWVALPGDAKVVEVDFNNDGEPDWAEFNQGLDLVGGLRVLLQAELPSDAFTAEELRETANSVSRRVNAIGLSEATVQVQGGNRILVELPGVTDPQQAIETIQQTAQLEFVDFGGLTATQVNQYIGQRILTTQQLLINQAREEAAAEDSTQGALSDATQEAVVESEVTPDIVAEATEATSEVTAESTAESSEEAAVEGDSSDTEIQEEAPVVQEQPRLLDPQGQPFRTVLEGGLLDAAVAEFQQVDWIIRFALNEEGAAIFGPFTAERIGEPLAIVLDGVVLSAPTIQAQLTDGGVISGGFIEDEAKQLAVQLRSGALQIPLRVESAETVGATLGQESVSRSIRAGIVGVIVVLTFMLIYYRVPGIAADLALVVFLLLNAAAFKLIPVTITLPAITGFLISIGTAVDGNILIFERLKEELRDGADLERALDSGFDRAWTSIRDSNLSTIIICGVLFLFGQTPGASIVSGFAVTLALGLVINLFTAVIVTRTFLYLIVYYSRNSLSRRKWLLGV